MNCRLTAYLNKKQHLVQFTLYEHQDADTAWEVAQSLDKAGIRVDPSKVAKVVMVWKDSEMIMLVVPASERVNFKQIRTLWKTSNVTLACETDFLKQFPDCELGAMPPFGNLYGLKVCVDSELENKKTIVFRDGTHTHAMELKYADFKKLVKPVKMDLTHPPKGN